MKRCWLHITLFSLWFFISSALHAVPTLPDSLFSKELPAQEKVYLHLDNNCYFAGDTIWYKAYVISADTYEPKPVSRILYIELLDEQGYLVERQKLVVDEAGNAHGQFALKDDAFAGYYEIRAYTKWMLNFAYIPEQILSDYINEHLLGGEEDIQKQNRNFIGLFSRVFPVYQKPDVNAAWQTKSMPLKVTLGDYERHYLEPKLNAHFYPESGHIVAGHHTRIGWETVNEQKQRIDVEGVLMCNDSIIMMLPPSRMGRGIMEYVFSDSCRYKVRMMLNGLHYDFDLPIVEKEGVTMRVIMDDEAVEISTEQTFAQPRELYVSVISAGHKVLCEPLGEDGVVASWLEDLPCGVNQATVFDSDGNIYADRLFFVNSLNEMTAKAYVNDDTTHILRPFEKVKVPIIVTDHRGLPLKEQAISVSVRDRQQLDPSFNTGNMLTNMLLESDVRGYVENPHYYFEANDEQHRADLDLLLMIQGWRRYDWSEIAGYKHAEYDYEPERKMYIYGNSYVIENWLNRNVFKKNRGDITITAQIFYPEDKKKNTHVNDQYGKLQIDANGRFRINYNPFYGTAELVLRALFDKKKNKGEIHTFNGQEFFIQDNPQKDYIDHDNMLLIRCEYFYPNSLKELSWYEVNKPFTMPDQHLTWEEYLKDIYASEWIPEVQIRADRAYARHRKDLPVARLDFYDFFNDFTDMGYHPKTWKFDNADIRLLFYEHAIYDYMQHQNPRSKVNKEKRYVTYGWQDEDSIEENLLRKYMDLQYLKYIYIVTDNSRRPSAYELDHLDGFKETQHTGGLSAYINLESGESIGRKGRVINLQGFNRPAEFYQPDYSHRPLPDYLDHRHTLYWNPSVTTDNTGQAYIEFYNSSECTHYDISVEGVTRNGEFIVKQK
ncbi:MAG: hypothetical protein K5899_08290 [Bacteroidaceae bacterium]|nr:hypothetical protein [Bacteroidaceae bacterium]